MGMLQLSGSYVFLVSLPTLGIFLFQVVTVFLHLNRGRSLKRVKTAERVTRHVRRERPAMAVGKDLLSLLF